MATPSRSELLGPEHPFPFPGVQDYLLEGTAVHIGELTAPASAGGQTSVQVIAIGVFEGKLLVALPQTAWHRVAARRLLAVDTLKKPVHAEVLAGATDDPSSPHPTYKLKVWVGLLEAPLVGGITYGDGDDPPCCFRGHGGLSLRALFVCDRRRTLCCCDRSGRFSPGCRRGACAFSSWRAGALLGGTPYWFRSWPEQTAAEFGPLRLRSRKGYPASGAGGGARFRGSRSAGIGSSEAARLGPSCSRSGSSSWHPRRAVGQDESACDDWRGRCPEGAPKAKTFARTAALNLLDESEAEEENEQTAAVAEGGPMAQAVIQMSKILTAMQKDRSNDLENLLDRADGGGGEAVSGAGGSRSKSAAYLKLKALLRASPEQISASIESLMAEDFAQVQSGPRQQGCLCSARGWVEHRSHLQQFAGPIRQAWLLAGMVDAINAGSPEQAKAMGLLGLASLDQAVIDGGNWLLASEYAMEGAPLSPRSNGLGS